MHDRKADVIGPKDAWIGGLVWLSVFEDAATTERIEHSPEQAGQSRTKRINVQASLVVRTV